LDGDSQLPSYTVLLIYGSLGMLILCISRLWVH